MPLKDIGVRRGSAVPQATEGPELGGSQPTARVGLGGPFHRNHAVILSLSYAQSTVFPHPHCSDATSFLPHTTQGL